MKIKHLEPCLLAHVYNSSTGRLKKRMTARLRPVGATHSKTVAEGVTRDKGRLRYVNQVK